MEQECNDNEQREQKQNQNPPRRSWNERLNRKQGKNMYTNTPGVIEIDGFNEESKNSTACQQKRNELESGCMVDDGSAQDDEDTPRRSWNERLNRKQGKNIYTNTPGVIKIDGLNKESNNSTVSSIVSEEYKNNNVDLESGCVLDDGSAQDDEDNKAVACLDATVSVVTAHVVNEKEEQELVERIKRLEEADTRVEQQQRCEEPHITNTINKVDIVHAVRISNTKQNQGMKKKGCIALLVTGLVVLLVIVAIVLYFVVGRSPSSPTTFSSYDKAYIHPGCNHGYEPTHDKNKEWKKENGVNLAFGTGWYCNDNKDVSSYGPGDFDDSHIHSSCHEGVEYIDDTWYCKDDLPSSNS